MNPFKKLWEKTVFSDMIAKSKQKKAEDEALRTEAVKEAEEELKPVKKEIIKEQYKEDEINRIKKGKRNFMEKLAGGFSGDDSLGKLATDDKINKMIGNSSSSDNVRMDSLNTDNKIDMILGNPMNTDKSYYMNDDEDKTDKIKMLFDEKDRSEKLKRMVK